MHQHPECSFRFGKCVLVANLATLFFAEISHSAAEAQRLFRCDSAAPGYVARTGFPISDPRAFSLSAKLDDELTGAPEARIAYLEDNPGGGHSRLGRRYLARLFGYPGDFQDGNEVEAWLAAQERTQPRMRGMLKVWKKWSTESRLLLTVVDYDDKKSPYDSSRLFHGAGEEGEFLGCVARDIAELKCENSTGTNLKALTGSISESALVYYHPDPNAQVFCEVRKPAVDPLWYAQYRAQVKNNGQRAERRVGNQGDLGPLEDFTLGR